MDKSLIKQITENLREKGTEELIKIWKENDRNQYSDEAFEAIKQMLVERGQTIPPQKQLIHLTQPKSSKLIKRRLPIIALLCNIFSFGLGHLYSGRFRRGLLIYVLGLAILWTVNVLYHVTRLFWIYPAIFLVPILFFILAPLDAFVVAIHSKEYKLKWFNKWYWYLLYFFLISPLIIPFLFSNLTYIRNNLIQAYKMSASSMEPTLRVGDHLLVDRRIYQSHQPSRGDIAVFIFPKDPRMDMVKRIVGVPGDTIEIKNKVLYMNNKKVTEPYAIHLKKEILSGGINPRDNFGPVTVPPDHFFTLGDNRDNSFDSRFWGFVSREQLKGRAMHIYFSKDQQGTINWDRIGKKIE